MSEGILNRLVRAHLSKGVKDKGKMHYELRVDNASPLVLNGLAALGVASSPDEDAQSPGRYLHRPTPKLDGSGE